jgi:hypothetical protein
MQVRNLDLACFVIDSPKFTVAQTMMHDSLALHGYCRRVADNMDDRDLSRDMLMQIELQITKPTYSAYCPATAQYADSSPGPNVVTKAPMPFTRAYPSA